MYTKKIKILAEEYTPYLIQFRRELHRYPELSMQEYHTSERIAEELSGLEGMEVSAGAAGGTGVIGVLHGKNESGKCVLLRADIDALPISEKTNLPFASENAGVMHACGHDGHAAWLLGSAKILSVLRKEFSGCIKFVFQPGGGRRRRRTENGMRGTDSGIAES